MHDYIIYKYSMDCIELSFFLTLFKPVFDFADTCKCTDLLVFAASTANIAHNCVEYLLRFYTQGLHAILHEPDTAKFCYIFIALLSLDQLCLSHYSRFKQNYLVHVYTCIWLQDSMNIWLLACCVRVYSKTSEG